MKAEKASLNRKNNKFQEAYVNKEGGDRFAEPTPFPFD